MNRASEFVNTNRNDDPVLLENSIKELTDELNSLKAQELSIYYKEAEETNFFNKILQALPLGIYIATPGKIIWANSYMEKFIGYSHEEIASWSETEFRSIFHPADLSELQKLNSLIALGNKASVGELRIRSLDGSWHWYHITASILSFPDKNRIHETISEVINYIIDIPDSAGFKSSIGLPKVLGTVINIDARKELESSLLESENKYKRLVSNLPDIIILVKNGKILFVNRAGEIFFNCASDQIAGLNISEIIPHQYISLFDYNYKTDGLTESNREADIEIFSRSGVRKPVRLHTSLVELDASLVLMCTFTDLSEIKKNESLRQYSKEYLILQEKERKKISKELNENPLPLLEEALRKIMVCRDEKLEDHLASIQDIVKLFNNTIEDIKNISYSIYPCVLRDFGLVNAVQKLADQIKKRSSIVFIIRSLCFPDNLPGRINVQLYRIFQEAFNNIEKHSKATVVIIIFNYIQDSISISISDNGVGFSEKNPDIHSDRINFGLRNMRERAHLINGKISIISKIGNGVEINISVPYENLQ